MPTALCRMLRPRMEYGMGKEGKDGAQRALSTLRSRATAEDGRPTAPTDGLHSEGRVPRAPIPIVPRSICGSSVAEFPISWLNPRRGPPTPALSARRGRIARRAGADPERLDSSQRGMRVRSPCGEGQGEGEEDAAHQNGRKNSAGSARPARRVKVG